MNKNRQSIRLKNYDYSQNGLYFVTICTQNRENMFGDIVGANHDSPVPKMVLNEFGKIVENVWESLPKHHPVELDTFQIMPNHVHFVIQIVTELQSGRSRPTPTDKSTFKPTLGFIVGMLKTESTKQINQYSVGARRDAPQQHKIWQRNYYEHIIRTENDLNEIREYIKTNPQIWDRDRNNI